MVFGDPVVTISIDHVWSIDYGSGPSRPAIWWGSYIKGDKGRTDLWGTGKWWMECPGLHGADDPLNQGPNFAVKRDGIDLVAHYLGYDLFWLFEKDSQVIIPSIVRADDELWFYDRYPEHLDTKKHYGRWFFEKTSRWPDWEKYRPLSTPMAQK